MSYEHEIAFEQSTLMQQSLDKLMQNKACTNKKPGEYHLKNPLDRTLATYDIRLTKSSETTLWMEVVLPSKFLLELIASATSGMRVKYFEDGFQEDEASLKEALHIKI